MQPLNGHHNPNQSIDLPPWRPGDPVPPDCYVIEGDGLIPHRIARRANAPARGQGVNRRTSSASALCPTYAPSLAGRPIPERSWVVPGWLPDNAVSLLGGDGGTGKSLLSLQLMVACASGKLFLGMPVKQCRAFALFCEDDQVEVHIRLAAIARHNGVELGDLEGVGWSARSGKANVLMHFANEGPGKTTALWEQLVAEVKDFGAQLVIIDTIADTFSGNENFRGQARAFINQMRQLAQEINGAVVLTAHPSVAGQNSGSGLSGSTAWNNSVRCRLYLTRPTGDDTDPNVRVLRRMKANYAGAGDEIRMRWRDGVLIAEGQASGIVGTIERRQAERVFLELLDRLAVEGRPVSDNAHAPNFAPKIFAGRPDREGYAKSDLRRAMEALFAAGKIRMVEYGRTSDRRRKIARVEPST